jgi:hypothetical protein
MLAAMINNQPEKILELHHLHLLQTVNGKKR